MYTVRQLIDANRRALANRTLGAFLNNAECLYDYGNGCRCAIGVVLTDADLEEIRVNDANHSPVTGLIDNALIEVEDAAVFGATQRLHDTWLSRRPFYIGDGNFQPRDLPMELRRFITDFQGIGIMESNFVQWLDLLDKHFPAQTETAS